MSRGVRFSIVTRIVAVSAVSLGSFAAVLLLVVRRTVERAVYMEIDARIQVAQKTFWDLVTTKGPAGIREGRLELGAWRAGSDHSIVDHLKELTGADATIFQMTHGHLIRVSTTVELPGGAGRNIGTELSGPALAAFYAGQDYAGVNPVAGRLFIVRYDALRGPSGEPIGMLFTGIPLASMHAATGATMRIVLTGTPIALVISILILYVVTRPLHRTIRRAVDVAKGLAKGDVNQKTDRPTNDELGEVNVAFNDIIAYHQRMVYLADAIAGGNLSIDVVPSSDADRLGMAFARMTGNLRDLVAQLETTALTDKLTQLGNRRAFDDHLTRELSRASRHHEPLCLAFIDVDNFKAINDLRGHQGGDDVLATLGRALRKIRLEDRNFRLGGDEFAIVMPSTTVDEAKIVAERLQLILLEELPGVTLSIGLADASHCRYDEVMVRANADAALYKGKARGRNTVVGFEAPGTEAISDGAVPA